MRNEFTPYTTEELINLIADIKPTIPRYCRVNRVIRDIPSNHVVEGNKRTSLRQDVHIEMKKRGTRCNCIRCREVRRHKIDPDTVKLEDEVYQVGAAEEHFLSFITPKEKLAGFLRLSLPGLGKPGESIQNIGLDDLKDAAIIREVHIYGQSLEVGLKQPGVAQHSGLGTDLILKAESIAQSKGFKRLAVIAAVGTRRYYLGRGFIRGKLYLYKDLS
jgi:elongator complex protein 3